MLKLYTSQACPFAHRCRLALAFKGLSHQRVEIDLADMPEWYLELYVQSYRRYAEAAGAR